ncbi:uncharacterized protein LOC108631970 isoform X2 [Ceratina calcarata]|nr:uncharacterized protein LOC108631970 isoform X2 [Ceratina calcarata]
MEIRGFNWNEPTDLPENLAEDPMPGTSGINTIQSETLLPHEPISQREFLIEGSEINILAPSTPEKRPLTSPTEPPSKRSKIQPISAERELIPTTLIELEPAPVPVAEIILEQQSEQQIETHAMAPPRLSLEQQLIEASEQFNQMRTQRRIIIDRHTMLDGTSMRRRMENVTFQTTLKPCKVSLPLKLSAQEHLTKPAMHMFGTKWGKTLMTSFRRRLTYPSMVPDEFDVPRFDDVIAEEILRKDETSKVPDQTVEISQLARLETTDQSKTLERTAPLLDVERELVDQIAEQPQAESLVQVPEITVHEEKPEEAVVTVRKTFVRSSSMRLTKQDLLAQMEVLWSNQLWINFHELLPHNCSKIETARTFVLCLELHAEKVIVLKQADAFGTIWIEKYVEYSESETSTEVTSS